MFGLRHAMTLGAVFALCVVAWRGLASVEWRGIEYGGLFSLMCTLALSPIIWKVGGMLPPEPPPCTCSAAADGLLLLHFSGGEFEFGCTACGNIVRVLDHLRRANCLRPDGTTVRCWMRVGPRVLGRWRVE